MQAADQLAFKGDMQPALCETVKLMDWVFDSFSIQAALDTDLTLAEIPTSCAICLIVTMLFPTFF